MPLSKCSKAIVPLVSAGLVWIANFAGVSPNLITDEVSGTVSLLLVGTAAAVYQIPNKEKQS